MGGSGHYGTNADEYGAHLLRGIVEDVERAGSLLIGAKADAATEEDIEKEVP